MLVWYLCACMVDACGGRRPGPSRTNIHPTSDRPTTQVRSKLQNPLGVAERLTAAAQASLQRRQQLLHSDLATLRLVDDQVGG